jgi:glycosyltransferase involved in cell wall biosynthesis
MRVVIVAQHASTKYGGEAFLPLQYFRLLRSHNIETWLVVHARTQPELEALFPEAIEHIHFIADTWIHVLLYKFGLLLPKRVEVATTGLLSHLYTQILQRCIVRKLVKEHQIDIVHEPIPVSPKYPSLMFDVGTPVIMGPLNGGMEFPPAFRKRQSLIVELLVNLSRKFSNFVNQLMPGKLKAQTLLVSNERTKQALPAGVTGTIIEFAENGVDLSVWQPATSKPKKFNQRVHFVFMGRLVDWKAVDLLLEAFSPVAAKTNAILEIVGDGKLRKSLEEQATRLGLNDNVIFSGWLSQQQCARQLQQADVLVLPSLLECGGAVILEAMAMELPIIATNWGGPSDYVDSTCGILISPTSKEALVNGLTDAMLKLVQLPELRQSMGKAGRERVIRYFDWDRKIDRILEIYQQTHEVCQNHSLYASQRHIYENVPIDI